MKKAIVIQSPLSNGLRSLRDLKAARVNPRKITVQNLEHLKSSIKEFGDISGVVFNRRTGELVSGHQRVFAMMEEYGDLPIEILTQESGVIRMPNGERFPVRIVDWTEDEQLAASIAANSPTAQGIFTNELTHVLENLNGLVPNIYEALGFANLRPFGITDSEIWENEESGYEAKESAERETAAREGKALTEDIAKDVRLEARFEFKVPEKLVRRATDRLVKLAGELPGSNVRRLD